MSESQERARRWKEVPKDREHYWLLRNDAVYLQHVYLMARIVARDADSLLDVGSNGGSYLEWFDWIPQRTSLDLRQPYESESVIGITKDFLAYEPEHRVDLTLCLQVLEHVEDAAAFAERLLAISNHVIISVPFMWPEGTVGHLHHMIDDLTVLEWAGRPATYSVVTFEPFRQRRSARLISYYDVNRPQSQVSAGKLMRRRKLRTPATLPEN